MMDSNPEDLLLDSTQKISKERNRNMGILIVPSFTSEREIWEIVGSQVREQIILESFKETVDANSEEFKPIDGEIKNTLNRLNVDSEMYKNIAIGDNQSVKFIVLMVLGFLVTIFVYNRSRDNDRLEEMEVLSQETQRINLTKTNLESHDLEERKIRKKSSSLEKNDHVIISKEEREAYNKRLGVEDISREEKKMKLLTPDLDILIPDDQNSSLSNDKI